MATPWVRMESNGYWLTFLLSFVAVGIWELLQPLRNLSAVTTRRWGRHGLILVVHNLLSVAVYRVSPVILAVTMMNSRLGILNKTWIPFVPRFVAALLVLDLVKYAVHRSYHAVPFLWRAHHVHHSDPDFDLSTGVRAHPIETILMLGATLSAIAILAIPPAAVLTAELFSCAQTFFSHANASLPEWLERPLRWVFITPDLHRIHHSEELQEQWTNLGDVFSWWDRVFRTYLDIPASGKENLRVGLKGFQNDASLGLAFMLLHPFRLQPEEEAAQATRAEKII
jgi:sterol desaturase/sphingolipid hydroxylase (fatty acid hydroxylase superfamily)